MADSSTSWDISGKRVVLTGGTTGIGRATVLGLAKRGAEVIFTARKPAEGDAVVAEVNAAVPGAKVSHRELHLDDLDSVRAFANALKADFDRIDVLVNNAGISLTERRTTKQGFEATFGVNHLGHFLLAHELQDLLEKSAPARIVVVASGAHRFGGGLVFEDLQSKKVKFGVVNGMKVYGRSKLANVLFTRELARRLSKSGVTVNCLHPGFVSTRLARDSEGTRLGERLIWPLVSRFAKSPEEGALTSLYAICDPALSGVTGAYLEDEKVSQAEPVGRDDDAARRLWDVSEGMVGIT